MTILGKIMSPVAFFMHHPLVPWGGSERGERMERILLCQDPDKQRSPNGQNVT